MLPRPVPLLLAVLCGMLVAPLLTPQTYWRDLPRVLGKEFPVGMGDLFSMAACGLSLLLFPLIGQVYTLADRKNRSRLSARISGAALAAWLVTGFQFFLGPTAVRLLGVEPSTASQATRTRSRSWLDRLSQRACLPLVRSRLLW